MKGRLWKFALNIYNQPVKPVAIKAFSLTVLQKLAKKYPEIIPEIKLIIEEQLPHQSAAFKSRAKKFLKDISLG